VTAQCKRCQTEIVSLAREGMCDTCWTRPLGTVEATFAIKTREGVSEVSVWARERQEDCSWLLCSTRDTKFHMADWFPHTNKVSPFARVPLYASQAFELMVAKLNAEGVS
jgi:hypothetical protein